MIATPSTLNIGSWCLCLIFFFKSYSFPTYHPTLGSSTGWLIEWSSQMPTTRDTRDATDSMTTYVYMHNKQPWVSFKDQGDVTYWGFDHCKQPISEIGSFVPEHWAFHCIQRLPFAQWTAVVFYQGHCCCDGVSHNEDQKIRQVPIPRLDPLLMLDKCPSCRLIQSTISDYDCHPQASKAGRWWHRNVFWWMVLMTRVAITGCHC